MHLEYLGIWNFTGILHYDFSIFPYYEDFQFYEMSNILKMLYMSYSILEIVAASIDFYLFPGQNSNLDSEETDSEETQPS